MIEEPKKAEDETLSGTYTVGELGAAQLAHQDLASRKRAPFDALAVADPELSEGRREAVFGEFRNRHPCLVSGNLLCAQSGACWRHHGPISMAAEAAAELGYMHAHRT